MTMPDKSVFDKSYQKDGGSKNKFKVTEREANGPYNTRRETADQEKPLMHNDVKDPSRSRLVVTMVACLYLQMAGFGMTAGLGVIYVELIGYFDAPRSAAALVQSMYGGFCMGGGILFSAVVAKYDTGFVIMVSSVCATIAFAASALAPNIETVIVLMGVMTGIACSVNILGAFVVVSWVFHRNRKFALSVLTLGSTFGHIGLPYIATSLIDAYKWTGAMPIIGAIAYLNGVPCGLIVHFSKRYFQKGDAQKLKNSKLLDIGCITDAAFMIYLASSVMLNATISVEQWFVVDMGVVKGFTIDMGATLLSINGLLSLIGRVIGSLILKLCKNARQDIHLTYGFCLTGVSHIIISQSPSYIGMLLGIILRGFAIGIVIAFLPGLVIDLRGIERFPQAMAISNLLNGFSAIAGGALGGLSFDITRSYDLVFIIACVVNIFNAVTMLLIYAIFKHRRNKTEYETL